MIARDDLLEAFLGEGRDLAARARADLSILLRDGDDEGALAGLFRSLHTLKGSAGFLDLPALLRLLHAAEALLEVARRGTGLSSDAAEGVGRALNVTDAWLDALDADGAASDRLIQETTDLASRLGDPMADGAAEEPAGDETPVWAADLAQAIGAAGAGVAIRYRPDADAYFRGEDPLTIARQIPGLAHLDLSAPGLEGADETYDPFRCRLEILALSTARMGEVRQALRLVSDQVEFATVEAAPASGPSAGLRLRTLRVDAQRLDAVAALMDELVIAKNALIHQMEQLAGATGRTRELANTEAAVERVTGDLHAAVTDLRLVTLGHLFSRFPRQVAELAEELGKDVEFQVSGAHVALDKSVVEGLFEPLLHLLRNAVDHGVEPPDARRAAGKRERALLSVTARTLGEEVTIDVADDGRGIDAAAVRAAAVARGVVTAAAAQGLSDDASAELLFAPGFSTASEVSHVSGRGVGLDAVRAAVAQMGGRVSLANQPGQGLCVRLSLPAQVVLTKVLVVKAAGERFGVPLEAVLETHRVSSDEVTPVRAGRAYVRRDNVIPLLRLSELLGGAPGAERGAFPVLNVDAGGERIGIQIEEIAERVEAPLRPMSGLLAAYPGVLGTILQGDGQVLLVLDLAELAA